MRAGGSRLLEAEVREELERDLRALHAEAGPWDFVAITGDVTASGLPKEFAVVDTFLEWLRGFLGGLGSNPVVLAVPGNHDALSPRVDTFKLIWRNPEFRNAYRASRGDSMPEIRRAVATAFHSFGSWYRSHAPPLLHLTHVRPKIPGDLAYVVEKEGRRLGVLGLNSAYAQLGPGDWLGQLDVDARFAREALEALAEQDEPWLLLTHHPPAWLLEDTRQELAALLSKRTALHLCGQAFPSWLDADAEIGTPTIQALRLGYMSTGTLHAGYCAGSADFETGQFRIWPRRFVPSAAGKLVATPDQERFDLSPDGSLALPWGTQKAQRKAPRMATPQAAPLKAPGITQRRALGAGREPAIWLAWSPDGARLASGHARGAVAVWDVATGDLAWSRTDHEDDVQDVAFSHDGSLLASVSLDRLFVWYADRGDAPLRLERTLRGGFAFAWRPGRRILAFRGIDAIVRLWEPTMPADAVSSLFGKVKQAQALAWSPDGTLLATVSMRDGGIEIWNGDTHDLERRIGGKTRAPLDLSWTPDGTGLAAAYGDGSVRVWDIASGIVATLAAHTDAVTSLSFSHDGRLLATKSHDGTVKLWRSDTWDVVTTIDEYSSREFYGGLAFSPTTPMLATLGSWNIRIWDIDTDALLAAAPKQRTVHSTRAKVVLVGEGNAGKSCLAMRLSEDRYAELGATHGMRFWSIPASRLDPEATPPEGEEREITLWDLGGQSEYRLIHQLFLGDTTTALMLMEPRRGGAALDEIEGWLKRFESKRAHHPAQKILVGTKLDDEHAPADRAAIEQFVRKNGFAAYVPTSAKTGRGLDEVKRAIVRSIDWGALAKTSQPELFLRIRHTIEAQIAARRVVLPFAELEGTLRQEDPGAYDPEAVRAVVRQLALQGVLADTRLADGTRALVLQVEQIERYASSLIVMARDNPRGIAAIDVARLVSPALELPRMRPEERLRRDQELIVLDCVVELLLEHGICIRHEGLLVFPNLFQPTEHDPAFPHAVALYYEFSGAVDNIYASLVTSLAMSRHFGPMRLWEDRAEFSRPGGGTVGARRSQRGEPGARGVARLDVYFAEGTPEPTRELFVGFVEEHLREHGVEILESLAMTCACGFEMPEKAVRGRIEKGLADIACPMCEARHPLPFGAAEARERSPDLARRVRAMKTTIEDQRRRTVVETKVSMNQLQRAQEEGKGAPVPPIRILHLSDLHVREDADPMALLQPLAADLEDRIDGLGIDRLDVLVVSGDVTNRAAPAEFEKARELVSGIIARFGLTAEQCVLVPGNHDLDWNEPVYRTVKKRSVDEKSLLPGKYKPQGDLYEIRDDALYPNRFRNFSQYFYHPLVQEPYPLAPEGQCIPLLYADLGLQFLALNSAWEIDEYFPDRSGAHPGALARGLAAADLQIRRAREEGRLAARAPVLRIATWHHPVTGNEKMADDAFVENLRKADVRLCLHGHVHEDRADLLGYLHPTRGVHVAGAGSFGAPARERPESIPRLYNVIEIERDLSRIQVHTRCLKKQTGAWEGWAVWPGARRGEKRSYYEVALGS
ncbi:metallophosphoesterase [Polyangium aurulentum]|nr:metallophosphoesterase [Polyangium aurulentum]